MPITSVNADGWRATYSSTPPTFDPEGAPEYVAVVRTGYDATRAATGTPGTPPAALTNIAENFIITRRISLPYPANPATDFDGNDVALSDYVLLTDTISGVTNNSTETSPKPIANWITPPDMTILDGVLRAEVTAWHWAARNGRQVAAVKLRATDGTTTVSQTVSAETVSTRVGDMVPVVCYAFALDVSTLTNGIITYNAEVFPWIGGTASVLDSADQTGAREFSPRQACKKSSLVVAYLDLATGNDSTGIWSDVVADAQALPFATNAGAHNAITAARNTAKTASLSNGLELRLRAGTHVMGAGTTANGTTGSSFAITADPLATYSAVEITFGTTGISSRVPMLVFKNIRVRRTGSTAIVGSIVWENVDLDNGSVSAAWMSNGLYANYFHGIRITNLVGSTPLNAGTSGQNILRGVSADLVTFGSFEDWLVIGCQFTRNGVGSRGARTGSGSIRAFNKLSNTSSSNGSFGFGSNEDVTGGVIWQNLIENMHASSSTRSVLVSPDPEATGSVTHALIGHNTTTGAGSAGRYNLFYDNSTVATRTHKFVALRNDLCTQINTKADRFTANGARLGNRAFDYGVGCWGNYARFSPNSPGTESQLYPGLKSAVGTSDLVASATDAAIWVDYKGTTVSAGGIYTANVTGGGNYALVANSPANGRAFKAVTGFDITGAARRTDGTGAAGAYERAAAPVVAITLPRRGFIGGRVGL